jgi:hypothetical protein
MEIKKRTIPLGHRTTRSVTRIMNIQQDDNNEIQEKEVIDLEQLDQEQHRKIQIKEIHRNFSGKPKKRSPFNLSISLRDMLSCQKSMMMQL